MCLREINRLISQGDLRTHSVFLGGELHGFVYKSNKGKAHIFIDDSLSPIAIQKTKLHEGGHVIEHLSNSKRMIGINNANRKIEAEADCYVHKESLHQLLAEM